jgi:hypothetical protein
MSTSEGTDRTDGTDGSTAGETPNEAEGSELDEAELTTRLRELRAENRRLREAYARTRQTQYRRSAAALLALGVLAVVGALVLPTGREILFILGAIGLFGGALTWFLTPERFVTATVGRTIYESVADMGARLRTELGLQETNVYVPVSTDAVDGVPIRLFVPQSSNYDLPNGEELLSLYVLPESTAERGIAIRPTAARLVREFEASVSTVADEPAELTAQLVDALVELFELVDGADPEIDAASNRVTVYVRGAAWSDAGKFDHPVVSFLGTGFAFGLDRPITVEVTETDGRTLVTCRWEEESRADADEQAV